jgi:hypothetical protein
MQGQPRNQGAMNLRRRFLNQPPRSGRDRPALFSLDRGFRGPDYGYRLDTAAARAFLDGFVTLP